MALLVVVIVGSVALVIFMLWNYERQRTKNRDLLVTGLCAQSAGYDTVDWDVSRPGYDTDTTRLFSGGKLEASVQYDLL